MIVESVYIFNGTSLLTIFDTYINSLKGVSSNRTIHKDIICKTDMVNYLLEKTLSDEFGFIVTRHEAQSNTYIGGISTFNLVDIILKKAIVPNWSICAEIANIIINIMKNNLVTKERGLYIKAYICNNNIHVMMYIEIGD